MRYKEQSLNALCKRILFLCLILEAGTVLYPEANEWFVGKQALLQSAGGGGTGLVGRGAWCKVSGLRVARGLQTKTSDHPRDLCFQNNKKHTGQLALAKIQFEGLDHLPSP